MDLDQAKLRALSLLKDSLLRRKDQAMQRFETHQQLCDQIIQGQRLFISEHSLLVPPQLQQFYDVYTKEGDNRRFERVLALDTARFTVKERSLPKISVPLQSRVQKLDQAPDQTLDLESDQESVRTVMLECGREKRTIKQREYCTSLRGKSHPNAGLTTGVSPGEVPRHWARGDC
uniref:Uncharacterized protein n=1 Tax=Knipowitschia caucasica TaxID=637954 RepID=A0AAV2J0Y4_KNICA